MPERLLIGPGSPPSLDPVYPELSPPLEPCRNKGFRAVSFSREGGAPAEPVRNLGEMKRLGRSLSRDTMFREIATPSFARPQLINDIIN